MCSVVVEEGSCVMDTKMDIGGNPSKPKGWFLENGETATRGIYSIYIALADAINTRVSVANNAISSGTHIRLLRLSNMLLML